MKVKEIYIKDFRQFKDFTIDLTYPKGHAKEGQPLDKVCFIGQSGTGKTNLLKLLYLLTMPEDWKEKFNSTKEELIDNVGFRVVNSKNDDLKASFAESVMSDKLRIVFSPAHYKYKDILTKNFTSPASEHSAIFNFLSDDSNTEQKLIYLPSGLKYNFEEDKEGKNVESRIVFDFSKESIYGLWNSITKEIRKYDEEILKRRQKISIANEQGDFENGQKEVAELKKWIENNRSPIKDIAENCINDLVKYFSLRVKEDSFIEQKEDIGFIKLERLDGKEMPYSSWSTGTRQVILSALPLYLIKPENSTILFDEPETSLYPDIQRLIIEYYQGFTKNSQFFYATHSPIIASSFEPWEIVELKFNDEGYIYRDLYFEGENHVDNYYIDPRYLNYDSMLTEVFDMEFTNSDKRYEGLSEFGMLKNQLEKLRNEQKLKTDEARAVYTKFKKLSRKLAINPEQYA